MRVAAAQLAPVLGERERNLEVCAAAVHEAAGLGCSLVVLPECSLSGYVFDDRSSALAAAEDVPGPTTERLVAACTRSALHCVVGLLERQGDTLYNTAAILSAEGMIGCYRKTHLPCLGVDRFVEPGPGPLTAHDTPIGRIGIEICYEVRFPEVTRMLALDGASVVAVPTNWPTNAASLADFVIRSRAAENRVFIVAANRTGPERGVSFVGRSQIVDPAGQRLAELDRRTVGLVYADIDPQEAAVKDLVVRPGEYEVSLFGDRRPELYGELVVPNVSAPVSP
jgi:predicted amidohydrolase